MAEAIDLDASVYETCTAHPEVKDLMAEAGFTEIVKPGMLQTMGKFMTIRKGCGVKGVDLDELVRTFQAHGLSVKGYEETAKAEKPAEEAAPASEPEKAPAAETPKKATTAVEREEELASFVSRLSAGEDLESVRADFVRDFSEVSAEEIAHAEQKLIEGGVPVPEVQKLCDVHSALFHGRTEEECTLSNLTPNALPQGHPVSILKLENTGLEQVLDMLDTALIAKDADAVKHGLESLRDLRKHYAKKEELLMPPLYEAGFTGPSDVMWGVDDEIVHELSALSRSWDEETAASLTPRLQKLLARIREMIYKEEQILFPLCQENFDKDTWYQVYRDLPDFGWAFIASAPKWLDGEVWEKLEAKKESSASEDGYVTLPTGKLTVSQLAMILKLLPVDLTFVDAEDHTQFFTNEGKVFARPLSCLGREVWSCHPPRVQPIVHSLIADFKSGTRDSMEVWMPKEGVPTRVQYLAVRAEDGTYQGTLEIVQQFADIQEKLEGLAKGGAKPPVQA
ncbi:MAG: DUF438 domain-containing protein [Atopobiaceae bacterium]